MDGQLRDDSLKAGKQRVSERTAKSLDSSQGPDLILSRPLLPLKDASGTQEKLGIKYLEKEKNSQTFEMAHKQIIRFAKLAMNFSFFVLYVSGVSEMLRHTTPQVDALPTGYNRRTLGENQTSVIVPEIPSTTYSAHPTPTGEKPTSSIVPKTTDVPKIPSTTSSILSAPTDVPQASTADDQKTEANSEHIEKLCHIMGEDDELRRAIVHSNKKFMKHLKHLCRELRENQDYDTEDKKIEEEPAAESSQQGTCSDLSAPLANISSSLADMKSFLVNFQAAAGQNSSDFRTFATADVVPALNYMHSAFDYLIPASQNTNSSLQRIESLAVALINDYKDIMASIGHLRTTAEDVKMGIENVDATGTTNTWLGSFAAGFAAVAVLLLFGKYYLDSQERSDVQRNLLTNLQNLEANNQIRSNNTDTLIRALTTRLQQIETRLRRIETNTTPILPPYTPRRQAGRSANNSN